MLVFSWCPSNPIISHKPLNSPIISTFCNSNQVFSNKSDSWVVGTGTLVHSFDSMNLSVCHEVHIYI